MSVTIKDYVNVRKRAEQLECVVPTRLAILPRNFEGAASTNELLHESSTPTIRVLWRQANVIETGIERTGENFAYVHEKAADWVGPAIFVSTMLLSQNPEVVTVALGVISNYLTDVFKGVSKRPTARLDIVVERSPDGDCTKIHYEGDAEGIADLSKVVKEVHRDG